MPSRCLAEVMRRVGCVFRRAVQFCNKRFDVFLVGSASYFKGQYILYDYAFFCFFAPTDL